MTEDANPAAKGESKTESVSFGDFSFHFRSGFLYRDGSTVFLQHRAGKLLGYLLERPREVVSRQELIDAVWDSAHVSDASVTEAIKQLRRSLNDDPNAPTYIQTIQRRGYRFIAPVRADAFDPTAPTGQRAVVDKTSVFWDPRLWMATTLVLAIILLILLLAGDARGAQGDAAADDGARDSHARMVERLAEIARQHPHGGDYVQARDATRRAFESMPATAPVEQRVRAAGILADAELKLGNVEAAIPLFQSVLDRLGQLPAETRQDIAITTVFLLAVSYLRQAQTDNCVERHTGESCILPITPTAVLADPSSALQAMPLFADIVRNIAPGEPLHLAAKWLLNITALMVGSQGDLAAELQIDPAVFAPESDFPRFENVAPRLGVATHSFAGGVVADDLDGDGLLDLMVSDLSTGGQIHVFRNVGDAGFVDVSAQSGLGGITGGLNLTHADYDNDGDVDVFVQRGAWWRAAGTWPNSLLRNDGNFHFTDVTYLAGLAGAGLDSPTQTAGWADYDNDGDLDLYVGNETTDDVAFPSHLFRNEGDGTFVEVGAAAGVTNDRWTKSIIWGDYDNDGFEDLFVSNYHGLNRLYRNNRDGTFTDVADQLGVQQPEDSFLSWFWDVDNDGNLDLLINASQPVLMAGEAPPIWQIAASRTGLPTPASSARLLLGNGDGTLRDASAGAGLAGITFPMGANFGDLDNDGWLDHYIGTGYPTYEALMPNAMYRGLGNARFEEITFAGGFGHLSKGHAIAFADLDNDGDQDVFEQMGGMLLSDPYPDALYENPGFGNHWLKLQLEGVKANRSAIGSRVRIDVDGPEGPRSIYLRVGTGASFGGNPLRVEVGLGQAERITGVEIVWAGSRTVQKLGELALDSAYLIVEGSEPIGLQLPTVSWSASGVAHVPVVQRVEARQ